MFNNSEKEIEDVEQNNDQDNADGSDNGDNYGDDGERKEYVKKEFFAKPYEADGITEESVNSLIIKNNR